MDKSSGNSSIPPLKLNDGTWALSAESKANAFAKYFETKWITENHDEFATILPSCIDYIPFVRPNIISKILRTLRENSASGSDEIATRVLKMCAYVLVRPIRILICLILRFGIWPDLCKHHWVNFLFNKELSDRMKNYRGIQLTHQLSKIIERLMSCLMKFTIDSMHLFGTSQFAYSSDHSSRDALLFMVCSWLLAFASHDRVGLYCSDVSGAFDNVCRNLLIRKLNGYFHGSLSYTLSSWLASRKANICVNGKMSNQLKMMNMIF